MPVNAVRSMTSSPSLQSPEDVLAVVGSDHEPSGALPAPVRVAAGASIQGVVTGPAQERVRTTTARDRVVAGGADEHVVAAAERGEVKRDALVVRGEGQIGEARDGREGAEVDEILTLGEVRDRVIAGTVFGVEDEGVGAGSARKGIVARGAHGRPVHAAVSSLAAHRKRIKSGPVGDEHERLVGLRIPVANAPQAVGVVALGSHAIQGDGLIGDDAERAVCCSRVEAMEAEVLLGAGDEKATA